MTIFIAGIFSRERERQHKEHLFGGWWIMLIPRVRDLDQESMKSFSLGSHNLTKLNEITSNICKGFSDNV